MKFSIVIALAVFIFSATSSGMMQSYPTKKGIYEKQEVQNNYEVKQPYGQNQYGYLIISAYNSEDNEMASKAGIDEAQSAYAEAVKSALSQLTLGAKAKDYGMEQESMRRGPMKDEGMGGKYRPIPLYNEQEYGMGQAAQAKVLYNKGMGETKPAKAIYNKEKYPKPEPYVNLVYQQGAIGQQEYVAVGKQVINIPAYQEGEAYGAEYGVPIGYKIPEYNYEPEPVGKVVILPELYEKVAPKRDFEKDININPRPIKPIFKEYETYDSARYSKYLPKYNRMKQYGSKD